MNEKKKIEWQKMARRKNQNVINHIWEMNNAVGRWNGSRFGNDFYWYNILL